MKSWRDEGSSCRRGTGCAYNIAAAFGGSKMTALPSRVMRRGVAAVTTVAVASACAQKKWLTPYPADAVEGDAPSPVVTATNPGGKGREVDLRGFNASNDSVGGFRGGERSRRLLPPSGEQLLINIFLLPR